MPGRRRVSGIRAGDAGEHYVAAELNYQGYIPALTSRNTKGIDVLCSNADGSRQVAIQVKTKQGEVTNWTLRKDAETLVGEHVFYVFVRLNEFGERPEFYVVPSSIVAARAAHLHREFLARGGRPNDMRWFPMGDSTPYLERWDLLDLGDTDQDDGEVGQAAT